MYPFSRLTPGVFTLLWLSLFPSISMGGWDPFAESVSPSHFVLHSEFLTLTLKGEMELEFHNLEGKGGPGFDSPTDTLTLGTRSPFFEIDAFWLAFRLGFSEEVQVNSILEFSTKNTRVGAIWADYRASGPSWLEHHVELGYNTPIIAMDRRTERYPLIATAHWREPEGHAAWYGFFLLVQKTTLELGASVAMMRPLGFAGVQDSTSQPGTINIVSDQPAKPFSGNGAVGGGRILFQSHGVFVDTFAFVGQLADEGGVNVLTSGFTAYRDLPGYDPGASSNRDYLWYGGRVGYSGSGLHLHAEGIRSHMGLIRRFGILTQGSFAFSLRDPDLLFHMFEPLIRWEWLALEDSTQVLKSGRALRSPALIDAITWDFKIWTFALNTSVYRNLVLLRLEFALIDEENGVPALSIPNTPIQNNEFMAQLELRF